MVNLKEKGFAHVLLVLLLLAGIGVGVYLVQTKTSLFSKAAPVKPDKPETSFELEAQADTSPTFADVKALKNVTAGQKFRVDIWARSDIDPANLFVAKLKFPADLLQVVEVNKRGAQSFVNQWVDSSYDNNKGEVSLVGGVNPPGLLTSSQSLSDVKGVSSALSANTHTASGEKFIKVGKAVELKADLSGTARSGQIWVAKAPDGKSDFTCPVGIFINSRQEKWCKIAEGKGPTLTGSFTPKEEGDYIVTVNAFINETATYTGNPADECSGNPFSAGPSQNPAWSYCGVGTDFTLTVVSQIPSVSPPSASLEGPNTLKAGDQGHFKTTLSGGAKSGQIWVTKGNGKSEFSCPTGENGKPYKASNGFYWCKVAEWNGSSIEGSYGTSEVGEYTAVVNAFSNVTSTYTGDPATECSGTPASLGFDASKWSDCGSSSRLTVNVLGSTPTPISTVPPKPTLMAARLMASIIFVAKQAGNVSLQFTDSSQILRISDQLNLLQPQYRKGLSLQITPVPVSTHKATLSLSPSSGTFNKGCNFSVNVNVDTGGAQTDGTDAILSYDPTKLDALSITNGTIYQVYPANDIDSQNGKIIISGLASAATPVSGKGTLATVQFKVKDSAPPGSTRINFDFDPNNKAKSTDSNVVERGTVVDALNSVVNGSYTIGTGSCGRPISAPIIPPSTSNLECTGIMTDAQLGKLASGENIYIVESGSKTKLTAEFNPFTAQIEWKIASNSRNLPDGGKFETPDLAVTNYIAPKNTAGSLEGVNLRADLALGGQSIRCPSVTLAIKPAQQQISTRSVKTNDIQVQSLRRDGDVNSDGKFTLIDMSALLARFGQENIQSEADLNGDGTINSVDVLKLRSILIQNGVLKGQ